jgi:hypothetical protein
MTDIKMTDNIMTDNIMTDNIMTDNIMTDTDIDETFDSVPAEIKMPPLLSTDELNTIIGLMKSKSNKEISDIISKLLTNNNDKLDNVKKMEVETSIMKNLNSSSKRELLSMLNTLVTQNNKYIVLESVNKLESNNNDEQISSDELRKKLHQKIFMSNKKNLQKMYEKMAENFQTENISQTTETTQTIESNDTHKQKKKTKKKNKINQQSFQNQIINQMAEIVKNNNI